MEKKQAKYYKVVKVKGKLTVVPSDDFNYKPKGFVATYSSKLTADLHASLGKSPF